MSMRRMAPYLYERSRTLSTTECPSRWMYRVVSLFLLVCAVLSENGPASAQSERTSLPKSSPDRQYHGQTVWDLSTIPEEKLDIGLWALIIAKTCDSTIAIDRHLATLDSMASAIRYMVGPRDLDMVKFAMTRVYLHDSGEWNQGRTFAYDLDDPLGTKPNTKWLSTYLDTRLGNCVSMPTLFLALMERVDEDVPFQAVLAPMHIYCQLRDRQDETVWNIEPTNGGHAMRDAWVVETFHIPTSAVDSGSYMRALSKREFLAQLLEIPISRLRDAGEYTEALKLAEIQLVINPKSLSGLINKAALLAWLGYTLQQGIVLSSRTPTLEESAALESYQIESDSLVQRAKALGWREETTESREQYLQSVAAARHERQ